MRAARPLPAAAAAVALRAWLAAALLLLRPAAGEPQFQVRAGVADGVQGPGSCNCQLQVGGRSLPPSPEVGT